MLSLGVALFRVLEIALFRVVEGYAEAGALKIPIMRGRGDDEEEDAEPEGEAMVVNQNDLMVSGVQSSRCPLGEKVVVVWSLRPQSLLLSLAKPKG